MKTRDKLSKLSLAISLTLALFATHALGAKPPKAGGGSVPPGTIYFQQSSDDFIYYAGMRMNADGSAKAQTVSREQGQQLEPSHQLHGGQRWFLTAEVTEAPDQNGAVRQQLFAVTESGAPQQLTSDSNVSVDFFRWAKDDSFLSFTAYIYEADGTRAGLFVAPVDWSNGSPVIGPPRQVLNANIDARNYIEIFSHDWSPSGDEVVYTRLERLASGDNIFWLEVTRFLSNGTTETRGLASGVTPQWSPDGSRIAFSQGSLWTIRPDGSDAVELTRVTLERQQDSPVWSPDSQHLAYTEFFRKQKGFQQPTVIWDIMRISATGTGITNLTSDTNQGCFVEAWR